MSDPSSTPPPTSTSATAINGDKLSGQLIIKAQLGDDIRKMMIHNEDLTLNELVLMMERVFAGKISNSDELTIKYLDDDGDKITLLNDSDLTVALHFHKLLRIFVLVNGQERSSSSSADSPSQARDLIDAKTFRNELQTIRDSVQTILDRLQLASNEAPTVAAAAVVAPPSNVKSSTTREFDPYKHLNQQQRSATPDDSRSNSNHVANNEHSTSDAQTGLSTGLNQAPPAQFQQMPTPHFSQSGYNQEQQAKTNVFGPPSTTFPGMPSLPNTTAPRFPPATTPNSSAPPTAFLGAQQTPSPPQQGGFYGQQQAPSAPQQGGFYPQQPSQFQQAPPPTNFNPNQAFPPSHAPTSTSNSGPATINPSFVPPPTAAQQPYGGYPPQNSYYNPVQQYPKAS